MEKKQYTHLIAMAIQNTIRIENQWKVISSTIKKKLQNQKNMKQRGDSVLSCFGCFFFRGSTSLDLTNIINQLGRKQ